MPEKSDWHTWVAENPPPDLQALVTTFGTYSAIPAWAWEEWDRLYDAWNKARISRLVGSGTWAIVPKARKTRRKKLGKKSN